MSSQISHLQLFSTIIVNISKLLNNIYKDYRPLLHLILSFIVIYIFYSLGKMKRLSTFEKKIIAINQYEDNIQKVSLLQKKRYAIIKGIRYFFGFLLVICVLFNVMMYVAPREINGVISTLGLSEIRQLNEKISITGGSVLVSLLVIVLLNKLFNYLLVLDKKQLTNLELQEQPEMNEVIKEIGPKALEKIKFSQCKEEYQKMVKIEANSDGCSKCSKQNSEVSLMRDKYQTYTKFIHGIFSFKWCDVCCSRKKTELYEQNQSPVPQKPFETEQEQVNSRINALYKQCERLDKYFKSICQKNCSYNYWKQAKISGKTFINSKTDINHLLETYHGKK